MRQYDFRAFPLSTAGGFVWERAMGGNPNRLTIAMASDTLAGIRLGFESGGVNTPGFYSANVLSAFPITFRDYGPIMQGEIWVATSVAVANLVLTEIFYIGGW